MATQNTGALAAPFLHSPRLFTPPPPTPLRTEIFEDLKNVLYTDSAVAGEAAGIAMGLLMLGSASDQALEDMLAYAHDTQHEKIIRGLAIGIALVMCGREEEADTLIEQLTLDKDPILRYGAMYTIALAYCGTANNAAIRRLLHVAVSDVSNDVRRAAVIALGFLLFKQPEQCPKLVSLLAESYNPHVRYGATLAVGISCAGTGLKVPSHATHAPPHTHTHTHDTTRTRH